MIGTEYIIETLDKDIWKTVPYIIDSNISWDSIAFIINPDQFTEHEISWKSIYGSLLKVTYRISKEFMNFRDPGNYDEKLYTMEFEIK